MDVKLSQRGDLTAQFVMANEGYEVKSEPILLSAEGGKYVVHESGFFSPLTSMAGNFGNIVEYDSLEDLVEEHGDISQIVTLEEYKSELQAISGVRDDLMHRAADIYNKSVDEGLAPNKIEYSGEKNYGRIERSLNKGVWDNDLPEADVEVINKLRGESSELRHSEGNMEKRLRDIDKDLAEFNGPDVKADAQPAVLVTGSVAP